MQFHLNGFRPGDPGIAEARGGHGSEDANSDEVDVLIVGTGPAGLVLAAQLASFPSIRTRVVEQRTGPLILGQADGVACRTMEMFEAFEFSGRALKEAYWVNETSFWKPDLSQSGTIVRGGRIQDTEDGLSEFPHVILNQARVHDFLLDVMRNSPSRLEPTYARKLLDLSMTGEQDSTFPVAVTLERLDPGHAGEKETVRARYVVGCDGARSDVRRALGHALHGDAANQAWGVMDVLAVTDFPDIRLKAVVQSANEGSLLVIPREGGYLVRLYVELDKLNQNERVAERHINIDHLIAGAQRILRPYTLKVMEVAWWSIYEIGQRLCEKFDDVPADQTDTRAPRVFIAGDACHTHSPKAGQGMNVSMQDSFNLGWKLASVVMGRCEPKILQTYSAERRTIAKELIDFDREFARIFSAPPKKPGDETGEGVEPAEFQRYFTMHGRFTAGTATRYESSIITGPTTHKHLAKDLVIGMRFHSAPVIRLADGKPMQLGHTVKADGRWRLFIFGRDEDPVAPQSAVRTLCEFLAESPESPIRKHTPAGEDIDSVIDVRAVFQQDHRTLALHDLPAFLLPKKGRFGLCDYEKMFCADPKSGQDIFDMRGIDRERGCVIVVRPDQYVAHALPIEATAEISAFFADFMLPLL